MKVRVTRASSIGRTDICPCEGAVLKSVTYYSKYSTSMEDLKQDKYHYNHFISEGTNHREVYDKFNNPCCIRDIQENIWVLTITSLKYLLELVNREERVILETEDRYKGIDYTLTIYDDYIE